jgi:catechol 2,3-dioxygenase-like lactoylglutathione lyase family enzyme
MRRTILSIVLVVAAMAAPAGAGELKANRIILRVADLKTSIVFYRDRVGLPLQSTFDEFAVLGGGDGITVMLQAVERKSNAPNGGLSAFTEVVFETSDVMKTYTEMKARGVVFMREPFAATTEGSRVLYAANFKDPDGHVLSITGWVPTSR